MARPMLNRSLLLGLRHVSLNGLFLPANLAVQQARRCCVALRTSTDFGAWPITNRGTGVLYAYGGRQFCVFTRHQLGRDAHPSQVVLRLTGKERSFYSGGRFVEYTQLKCGPEEHDLCLVELPWTIERSSGSPLFFAATPPTRMATDGSEIYFAIGYPSKLTQLEVTDDGASEGIALSQVLVWASQLILRRGDLPKLELVPGEVMLPRCSGDYDGFSGGPVFSVNSETRAIELRGIIIRGGIDKLFFASIEWVQKLCDICLTQPQIESIAA
jgi:hypothetical protein